ncbi:LysM peptidoglycan-binding domain-containing protein [Peribacillus kribbensis]|uniref:C40 family peptidase n=1 Tax=Peribacillus kribbensis TaxID=356658 RepID=UPI0004119B45|nr:peptidoglycan endopeptidase [Peribacillus kribbensis]
MKKSVMTFASATFLTSILAPSALADTYKVKKGDTLSKIAKNQSTTVAKLKELNHLSSDLIRIDQTIEIPGNSTPSAQQSNPQILLQQTDISTYTVVSGDTLIKIANQHGITLAELKTLNNIDSYLIYPGQKLAVSKKTTTTKVELPDSAPAPAAPSKPSSQGQSQNTYTVKQGDSLWKIAFLNKVAVDQLKSWNQLKSDVIQAGQILNMSEPAREAEDVKPSAGNTSASPAPAPAAVNASKVISEAKKYIGTPYSWAGSSPSGFDCSGFVYYVYKQAGYQIARVSASTYFDMGKTVSAPQPGDLIFFAPEPNQKYLITHMGISLGGKQFIHSGSSRGVEISSLDTAYYKDRFTGFKRLY